MSHERSWAERLRALALLVGLAGGAKALAEGAAGLAVAVVVLAVWLIGVLGEPIEVRNGQAQKGNYPR